MSKCRHCGLRKRCSDMQDGNNMKFICRELYERGMKAERRQQRKLWQEGLNEFVLEVLKMANTIIFLDLAKKELPTFPNRTKVLAMKVAEELRDWKPSRKVERKRRKR